MNVRPTDARGRALFMGVGLVLIAIMAVVDYLTGYELGFFVFYFLPIALIAWTGVTAYALGAAIFCAAVWAYIDDVAGFPYSSSFYQFWNATIRLVAFLSFSFMLVRLRQMVDAEIALNAQLRAALESEVHALRRWLPICASCKKIRDEKEGWMPLEEYFLVHTHTEFSHGICPECAESLYPELASKAGAGHDTAG